MALKDRPRLTRRAARGGYNHREKAAPWLERHFPNGAHVDADHIHFRFQVLLPEVAFRGGLLTRVVFVTSTMAYRGQGQKVQKVMVQPIVSYAA